MTEISQTPDGKSVLVSVTLDGINKRGAVDSMHGVACEAERLTALIRKECAACFIEPIHDA